MRAQALLRTRNAGGAVAAARASGKAVDLRPGPTPTKPKPLSQEPRNHGASRVASSTASSAASLSLSPSSPGAATRGATGRWRTAPTARASRGGRTTGGLPAPPTTSVSSWTSSPGSGDGEPLGGDASPPGIASEWRALTGAFGSPEWCSDDRFASRQARVEHDDELAAILGAIFSARPAEHWQERLLGSGLAASRADEQTFEEFLVSNTPHRPMTHPDFSDYWRRPPVIRIDGCEPTAPSVAPRLGKHTTALLSELGFSAEESQELITSSAVKAQGATRENFASTPPSAAARRDATPRRPPSTGSTTRATTTPTTTRSPRTSSWG